MSSIDHIALSRQSGLLREMQIIANNIANVSTTGFRREGMIFTEHVVRQEGQPSLSMAHGNARRIDLSEGSLARTGGALDLALMGEGFFALDTPQGVRLTRNGAFSVNAEGVLVTATGAAVLDDGLAPIVLPEGAAAPLIGPDGTVSVAGSPVARIGVVTPVDGAQLRHQGDTLFESDDLQPVEAPRMLQFHLEDSNVDPILEIARMIEVQRAYELGQSLLEAEDARTRNVIQTLGG